MDSCHPRPRRDPAPPDRCYDHYHAARLNLKSPLSPLLQPYLSTSLLPCHSFGSRRNAAGAGRSVAETCCCVAPTGRSRRDQRNCRAGPVDPSP